MGTLGERSVTLHPRYLDNLNDAHEFEDFVADVLYEQAGLVIHVYRSRKFQVAFGENRAGFEIKLDKRWQQTGNLFIETAERWNSQVDMKPAGIHGENWFYIQGDFTRFWLFATSALRNAEPSYRSTSIDTAVGFLMPTSHADRLAARIFSFDKTQEGNGNGKLPFEPVPEPGDEFDLPF